jgi:hypothetical protein
LDSRISDGINAIAGARICTVRESHGFGELRAVLTWSACPELFKNRDSRSGIRVEVFRVKSLGLSVYGKGFRAEVLGFRV